MKKKLLSLLLSFTLILAMLPVGALAAESVTPEQAARVLNELGLLSGVGTNPDGSVDFGLNDTSNRIQSIIMLTRLVGGEPDSRPVPFTDIPDWDTGYVSYAYHNGLTAGQSETQFGSDDIATGAQYITFVLRAMGYKDGEDFTWDASQELSNKLGFTSGSFNSQDRLLRSDMAVITCLALNCQCKSGKTLVQELVDKGALDLGPVVTVAPSSTTLEIGKSIILKAEAKNGNAVTWSSSDPSVAVVDSQGKVTAVMEGSAVITATAGSYHASCTVTVASRQPTSVTLSAEELTLEVGKTSQLISYVTPSGASSSVTWSSSNTAVATVSSSGAVTARGEGVTVIIAKAGDAFSACVVTVTRTQPTSVSLSRTELTMGRGESATLTASVMPAGANSSVTWSSSNADVAIVSSSGTVTALSEGVAFIVARAGDSSSTCVVTVTRIQPAHISLSRPSLTMVEGESVTLFASVSPGDADSTVTWSSSNTRIASVSDGRVTGVREGTAVITATASNGVSSSCYVTVTAAPSVPSVVVPRINFEYGPMTVTSSFPDGRHWCRNEITSLVFTKIEPSIANDYTLSMSLQGVMDYYLAGVDVYFYDANNRVLSQEQFASYVTPNEPYNILIRHLVDADVIENAVRIEFYSYSGNKAN